PLRRGMNLSCGCLGKTWLNFKYEKLPNFCFFCGCIRHVEKECEACWKPGRGPDRFGHSVQVCIILIFQKTPRQRLKVHTFILVPKQKAKDLRLIFKRTKKQIFKCAQKQ
ncbi:zf-CCHC_4 domain-containing protein, partial [Cephalotus follicularis]